MFVVASAKAKGISAIWVVFSESQPYCFAEYSQRVAQSVVSSLEPGN
jgi:hypothetical protein